MCTISGNVSNNPQKYYRPLFTEDKTEFREVHLPIVTQPINSRMGHKCPTPEPEQLPSQLASKDLSVSGHEKCVFAHYVTSCNEEKKQW